ncbi:50S ribosomal protein L17 [Candidatus Saccharibacteria bacterium]|jgi:large subunit ribosomal protein L17|nr:MAG: 50S ribosomal protein L17 [Candidatus Saccharibacteria bacterium]
MHRHGYRGRKFGRERDQRNALMRGLACSLITHQSIKTTTPKAKELRPFVEKLVTAAKKGDLANRRLVIARLADIKVGNLLVDQIAPQIKRDSGYLRITKLDENRVGDNAEMSRIEFVDTIKLGETPVVEEAKPVTTKKAAPAKAKSKGDK